MKFEKAYIPYGGYWSTPFSKWQGSFQSLHALRFAAQVATGQLEAKKISPEVFDYLVLGTTIPQPSCFYGAPWVAAMVGAPGITGPTISQACATGAQCASTAAQQVELGGSEATLVVTGDRCSNGPHLVYPNPMGPGATPHAEDWVFYNFGHDPYAKNAMIETAENVAREVGVTREEQDEFALLRYDQYLDATKDDQAFQKRYMVTPVEINPSGRKVLGTVEGDEGVFPTSAEGLKKLRPVMKEGTVTFGSQTHPADGNSSLIVASREKAKELSSDPKVEIQILSYGQSRTKKGYMAKAVVPAARQALERAGISIGDCKGIKTHNPFAVNDVFFCRELGVDKAAMNNYGSPLVWGHPQGPTGLRCIIELIEELVIGGGGYGLFAGCAAGDTGAAVVLKVDVA